MIPPGTPLPDGSAPSTPLPLIVELPPNPTPEQKRDALREALLDALVPSDTVENLVELLGIDDTGQVYITPEGIERLRELLDDVDIPEGAESAPLAVFKAALGSDSSVLAVEGGTTAVVFFRMPESFIGKTAACLQVVKMFDSGKAETFARAFSLEELVDGSAAVVEVELTAGGEVLKRVLVMEDVVAADCRIALAIKDGGRFDLDGVVNGSVTDPAFVIEAEKKEQPAGSSGGGSGCASVSFAPAALALLAPLLLLMTRR